MEMFRSAAIDPAEGSALLEKPDAPVLLRKLQRHHCTFAFSAVDANLGTVCPHDAFDNHHAQSMTFLLGRKVGFEYIGEIIRIHPTTGVGNHQVDKLIVRACADA